jgi:pimeloyl-ACP methyl ester carboxylesterase
VISAARRMTEVTIAGRRLEVAAVHAPRPGAAWVVFLHEGLGSAAQWRDYPARVAAATGCGTLVYSRRGYGRSEPRPAPWPDDFMTPEAMETLPALLAHFRIDRPVLVGHSDGGTIALMFAAAFPHACAGIISIAAHVMSEADTGSGIRAARQRFLDGPLRDVLRRQHGSHTDDTMFGWADAWLRVGEWDIRPSLRSVTCPVLVIQGRDDEFGTLAQVDAIAQGVGGPVEALVLDHCGHAPHREKRKAVLAAVTRFIQRL